MAPLKPPAARSIVVTKEQAATRQLEAAIEAFERGRYDIAITLAGAAEGMLSRRGLLHTMNQHRLAQFLHAEKRWIPFVNRELYWLKHTRGPHRMEIRRRQAVMMIRRAASKLDPTPRIKAFSAWFDANQSDAIR